tara:strand:+ start:51 stop:725 length:675 start_codon:yes stop_codon:yes gene_type:complete
VRKDSPHQVSQSCIHFLDLHLQRSFVLGYLAIYNLMLTEQTDCNDNVFNGDLKVTPELIRKVKIRATYSCDEESTCYLHPDGLLVCVNLQTGEITHPYPSTQSQRAQNLHCSGDYTSELGVSGNAITGEFTPASAGTSSVAAEDTPIETGSAESSSSTTVNSKASTVISSSSSPVPTKVSTVTSAGVDAVTQTSATPTQSTAGAGKLSTGTVVGALGLVVGFIL